MNSCVLYRMFTFLVTLVRNCVSESEMSVLFFQTQNRFISLFVKYVSILQYDEKVVENEHACFTFIVIKSGSPEIQPRL